MDYFNKKHCRQKNSIKLKKKVSILNDKLCMLLNVNYFEGCVGVFFPAVFLFICSLCLYYGGKNYVDLITCGG